MTTFRSMALLFLGITFCIGCGDSLTQPWEGTSLSLPEQKKGPKIDGTAHNDQEGPAGEPDRSARAMNPHEGMQMPAGGSDAKLENNGKLDIEYSPFDRAEIVDS